MRRVLFELRDVSLARGGRRGPRLGQRRRFPRARRRSSGRPGAASRPCCGCSTGSPIPTRRRSPTGAGRSREYDPLELRREVSLVPQLPALLEGTVESNLGYAARLAGKELDIEPLPRLAGLDPAFAEPRRLQALGRRAAAGDAGAGAGPGARRAAARRADLGARPRRPRRDRGDAGRAAARAGDLARRSSATTPSRRAGWATGWCGWRRAGSSAPARWRRCSRELARPRSTSPSGRSRRRWRWSRSRRRSRFWRGADLERDIAVATVRSFIQLTAIGYAIKLIFEADTIWLVLALLAVMVLFGAITARSRAKQRARTPSGRC